MIQEKRGLLKHWNMMLIILTYCARDLRHVPDALRRAVFRACLCPERHRARVLCVHRAHVHQFYCPADLSLAGTLRAETEMNSLLSREALFLLNNLLFISVLLSASGA